MLLDWPAYDSRNEKYKCDQKKWLSGCGLAYLFLFLSCMILDYLVVLLVSVVGIGVRVIICW